MDSQAWIWRLARSRLSVKNVLQIGWMVTKTQESRRGP